MKRKGVCPECQTAQRKSKKSKAIGVPVVTSTTVGRGYDQTEHRFFQVPKCGSVWVEYEDSGAVVAGRLPSGFQKVCIEVRSMPNNRFQPTYLPPLRSGCPVTTALGFTP